MKLRELKDGQRFVLCGTECPDDPSQLSDEELNSHIFNTEDGEKKTFRQHLNDEYISKGDISPQFFASTEY